MKSQVSLLVLSLWLISGEGRSAHPEKATLWVRRNACYRGRENRHHLFTSVYYLLIIQLHKYLIEQHWNKSVAEGSNWGSSIVVIHLLIYGIAIFVDITEIEKFWQVRNLRLSFHCFVTDHLYAVIWDIWNRHENEFSLLFYSFVWWNSTTKQSFSIAKLVNQMIIHQHSWHAFSKFWQYYIDVMSYRMSYQDCAGKMHGSRCSTYTRVDLFVIKKLRPRQKDCHFADGTFKRICMNENAIISINFDFFIRVCSWGST